MKKNLLILALSTFVSMPLFAMDDHEAEAIEVGCCNDLSAIAYTVGSYICPKLTIRTDYLYLAHADCAWWLKHKLAAKENLSDFDRYYPRYKKQINDTVMASYHTPLQEAVDQGNLECVKILLAAGADKMKKIRYASNVAESDIKLEEIAAESDNLRVVGCVLLSRCGQVEADEKIQAFQRAHHIGLSALQLAEKFTKEPYALVATRKEIYDLLKKQD